jgi:hypothetical protein
LLRTWSHNKEFSPEFAKTIFHEIDVDQSGNLEFDEFCHAFEEILASGGSMRTMSGQLEGLDLDNLPGFAGAQFKAAIDRIQQLEHDLVRQRLESQSEHRALASAKEEAHELMHKNATEFDLKLAQHTTASRLMKEKLHLAHDDLEMSRALHDELEMSMTSLDRSTRQTSTARDEVDQLVAQIGELEVQNATNYRELKDYQDLTHELELREAEQSEELRLANDEQQAIRQECASAMSDLNEELAIVQVQLRDKEAELDQAVFQLEKVESTTQPSMRNKSLRASMSSAPRSNRGSRSAKKTEDYSTTGSDRDPKIQNRDSLAAAAAVKSLAAEAEVELSRAEVGRLREQLTSVNVALAAMTSNVDGVTMQLNIVTRKLRQAEIQRQAALAGRDNLQRDVEDAATACAKLQTEILQHKVNGEAKEQHSMKEAVTTKWKLTGGAAVQAQLLDRARKDRNEARAANELTKAALAALTTTYAESIADKARDQAAGRNILAALEVDSAKAKQEAADSHRDAVAALEAELAKAKQEAADGHREALAALQQKAKPKLEVASNLRRRRSVSQSSTGGERDPERMLELKMAELKQQQLMLKTEKKKRRHDAREFKSREETMQLQLKAARQPGNSLDALRVAYGRTAQLDEMLGRVRSGLHPGGILNSDLGEYLARHPGSGKLMDARTTWTDRNGDAQLPVENGHAYFVNASAVHNGDGMVMAYDAVHEQQMGFAPAHVFDDTNGNNSAASEIIGHAWWLDAKRNHVLHKPRKSTLSKAEVRSRNEAHHKLPAAAHFATPKGNSHGITGVGAFDTLRSAGSGNNIQGLRSTAQAGAILRSLPLSTEPPKPSMFTAPNSSSTQVLGNPLHTCSRHDITGHFEVGHYKDGRESGHRQNGPSGGKVFVAGTFDQPRQKRVSASMRRSVEGNIFTGVPIRLGENVLSPRAKVGEHGGHLEGDVGCVGGDDVFFPSEHATCERPVIRRAPSNTVQRRAMVGNTVYDNFDDLNDSGLLPDPVTGRPSTDIHHANLAHSTPSPSFVVQMTSSPRRQLPRTPVGAHKHPTEAIAVGNTRALPSAALDTMSFV